MKPLNLIALLLFLGGAVWALTRSDRSVREIQAAYYSAMSPFLKSGSKMETQARAFLEEVRHSKELETKLKAVTEQRDRLIAVDSLFRAQQDENKQLREALDFKEATHFDLVAARVIRRNPTTWWQTVEIDAGSKRGVGTQLTVLSNKGLVGKIDRIDNDGERASVLLLTDEKCQVAARVEGSPEFGILSGQRGGLEGEPMLRLRFLPANAEAGPGQRVFTTGRGGVFQPNILLGIIESVERGPLDSEALVKPLVDFEELGAVFVILSTES